MAGGNQTERTDEDVYGRSMTVVVAGSFNGGRSSTGSALDSGVHSLMGRTSVPCVRCRRFSAFVYV